MNNLLIYPSLLAASLVGYLVEPMALAAIPTSPPALGDCDCEPAYGAGYYGCPDEVFSKVTIIPQAVGTCLEPWSLCLDADPCKWEYTLRYISSNPNSAFVVYWNGIPRSRAKGSEIELGPLTQQLDCGGAVSIAIGSNGNICIEALFECEPCPASQ